MHTAEWFLARVGSNVSLQQPWPGEGFAAEMAFAGQSVCANVHFQGTGRRINLSALVASHHFLHLVALIGSAVELLMLGESRVGGIAFAAIGALVPWWRTRFLGLFGFDGFLDV